MKEETNDNEYLSNIPEYIENIKQIVETEDWENAKEYNPDEAW